MKSTAGILLLLGAMVLAPTATMATHEETECTIGNPPGTVVDLGGAAYINERGLGSVWVYLESNDIAGLQTGGESPSQALLELGYTDDTGQQLCDHDPDTLLI